MIINLLVKLWIKKPKTPEEKMNYYFNNNKYLVESKVISIDEESTEQLETVSNKVYDKETWELVDTFTTYN